MPTRYITPPCIAALIALAAATLAPPPVVAQVSAQSVPDCPGLALYCIQLLPTPRFDGVRGHVEMARPNSPFGVTVTREGKQRYRLIIDIGGLPDPSSLGDYSTYVLWASPLNLDPMINLGAVGNGRFDMAEVSFNKFMLIVSPEPTANVTERSGPLVLRGRSPSSRMEPHNMFQLSAYTGAAGADATADHDPAAGHDHAAGGVGATWPHPPMHPGVTMMPGMEGLKPTVSPWSAENATEWLPADIHDVPLAGARTVYSVTDGDSISLRAHFVRKQVAGRSFVMLGYNGQIPGPLIDVPREATITATFINDTPYESSIHWHGLRHENRFDGVPGLTQDPVAPADTFVYQVHFPDAGLYWYHPHHREDIQQDLGLYGNMLVRSPDMLRPADREHILVFDDLTVGDDGIVPFGREEANYTLMGRFGNVLLVNGEPRIDLQARTGEDVRLFLTNVANTRTLNLSVDGHALKAVATDLGPFERATWVENVPMAPAERYIVDMRFEEPGTYPLVNHVQALDHARGLFFAERDTLAMIRVTGTPTVAAYATADHAPALEPRPDVSAEIRAFERWFDADPTHEVELFLRTQDLPPVTDFILKADQSYFHPVEWSGTMPMMNWATSAREAEWVMRDPATGRENMEIGWRFSTGDTAKMRIHNLRDSIHGMQHPIHVHGQRFLVVAYNGRPVENMAWKDTVLIPTGMTADIVVEFTNPGDWMMHCHIAEHLEAGMMTAFTVE